MNHKRKRRKLYCKRMYSISILKGKICQKTSKFFELRMKFPRNQNTDNVMDMRSTIIVFISSLNITQVPYANVFRNM